MQLRSALTTRWLGLYLAVAAILGGPTPSQAASLRLLQPGGDLTLGQKDPNHLFLLLKQQGQYVIETRGDADTFCHLSDRLKHRIAADDNSGSAKNCKLNLFLQAGLYKLHIKRPKRAIKVRLRAYTAQGKPEEVSEGRLIQGVLEADKIKSFTLTFKRRRLLKLLAVGSTIRTCRLLDSKGWRVNPSHMGRHARSHRYAGRCRMIGHIEPGTYTLQLVGQRSRRSTKSSFALTYGAQTLKENQWANVDYSWRIANYRFTFEVPATNATNKHMAVFQVRRSGAFSRRASWRLTLKEEDQLGRPSTNVYTLYGNPRNTLTTFTKELTPGKRYVASLYVRNLKGLSLKYFMYYPTDELVLGKRIRRWESAGVLSRLQLKVKKAGRYWIDAPKARSCLLLQRGAAKSKQLKALRGFGLPLNGSKELDLHAEKTGSSYWFQVPATGRVTFAIKSPFPYYAALVTQRGYTQASTRSTGRSLLLARTLPAGLYRLQLTYMGKGSYASPKLSVAYHTTAQKAAIQAASTGCQFALNLTQGEYTLQLTEADTTGLRDIGFFLDSLPKGDDKHYVGAPTPHPASTTQDQHLRAKIEPGTIQWATLQDAQSATYTLQVTKEGVYHVRSMGYVNTSCSLQHKASILSWHIAPTNAPNCRLIAKLHPGTYQIKVKAIRGSAGAIGLQVTQQKEQSGTLQQGAVRFGRLSPFTTWHTRLSLHKGQSGKLQVHGFSVDQPLQCWLTTPTGWLVNHSPTCQMTLPLKHRSKAYHLWVAGTKATQAARVQLFAQTPKRWHKTFPTRKVQAPTRKPDVAYPIFLNQKIWATVSPFGQDLYSLTLAQRTTFAAHMIHMGQKLIFRKGGVIVARTEKKNNTPPQLTLDKGDYQVVSSGPSTGLLYSLMLQTIQVAPAGRTLQKVPSKVGFALQESQRIVVQTQAQQDVWCSITNASGQQLARNDDANQRRWDCKLSTLLPPGQYTLHIEGEPKKRMSWLSMHTVPMAPLKQSAAQAGRWHTLPAGKVHGFPFRVHRAGLVQLTALSKGKELNCALARKSAPQEVLFQEQGTSCGKVRFLTPGLYRWRIYQPHHQASQIKAEARTIATKGSDSDKPAPLLSAADTKRHVLLLVKRAGVFQMKAPTKHTTCALARADKALQALDCTQHIALQKGLWHFATSAAQGTLSLTRVPLRLGAKLTMPSPAGQVVSLPVEVKDKGLYRVVLSSRKRGRWGCHLAGTKHISPNHTTHHKCDLLVGLSKGKHLLRYWRPESKSQPKARVTLSIKRLPMLTETGTFTPGIRQWSPKGAQLLSLKTQALKGTMTLHGRGWALLLGRSGKVLASCSVSGETRTCHWQTPARRKAQRLFVGGSSLHIRAALFPTPQPSKPIQIRWNGSFYLPQTPKAGATSFLLVGSKPGTRQRATLEVVGGDAQCTLFVKGPVFRRGCRQSVKLGWRPQQLVIHYKHIPTQILLFAKGAKERVTWGASQPPKISGGRPITPRGQSVPLYTAGRKMLRWLKLYIKRPGVVKASIFQRAVTCALFGPKRKLLVAHGGQDGCRLVRPLQKGIYWVGVRHIFSQPLRGSLHLNQHDVTTLKQGRSGTFLLAPGSSQWISFAVQKQAATATTGVGVVAPREDLLCRLYDQKHRFVGQGCQQYQHLPPGTYRLQVSMPVDRAATAFQVVLRGLKRKEIQPPSTYIRRMMRAQRK